MKLSTRSQGSYLFVVVLILLLLSSPSSSHVENALMTNLQALVCQTTCKNGLCIYPPGGTEETVTCRCHVGWRGRHCDYVQQCGLQCAHGKCVHTAHGPSCVCSEGYAGTLCDGLDPKSFWGRVLQSRAFPPVLGVLEPPSRDAAVLVADKSNRCADNFVCQNGGLCVRGTSGVKCECSGPFTGVLCHEPCFKSCLNGGHCIKEERHRHNPDGSVLLVDVYSCECPWEYQGIRCEVKIR